MGYADPLIISRGTPLAVDGGGLLYNTKIPFCDFMHTEKLASCQLSLLGGPKLKLTDKRMNNEMKTEVNE